MESTAGKKNVYRVAKQMAKSRQDVLGVNFVKDAKGKGKSKVRKVRKVKQLSLRELCRKCLWLMKIVVWNG